MFNFDINSICNIEYKCDFVFSVCNIFIIDLLSVTYKIYIYIYTLSKTKYAMH